MRRVGKSFLLFTLFREQLIESGFPNEHIISFSLDDWHNRQLRKPNAFFDYLERKTTDVTAKYMCLRNSNFIIKEHILYEII